MAGVVQADDAEAGGLGDAGEGAMEVARLDRTTGASGEDVVRPVPRLPRLARAAACRMRCHHRGAMQRAGSGTARRRRPLGSSSYRTPRRRWTWQRTNPLTGGPVHGVSHPRQHPDHLDDPTSTPPVPGHRTSRVRERVQAPLDRVSDNFLYGFKARARRGRAPPLLRGLPPVFAPAGRARRRATCCGQRRRNPLWLGRSAPRL